MLIGQDARELLIIDIRTALIAVHVADLRAVAFLVGLVLFFILARKRTVVAIVAVKATVFKFAAMPPCHS